MDTFERLIAEVTYLKRQLATMVRHGTVKEVKGDKIRTILGKDKNGKDVLGPWLDTSSHRGGSRERKRWKEGQNVMMLCPNGDVSQALIIPHGPNKDNQSPDHANEDGKDEETYQFENVRTRTTKDGYAIWMQEPKQEGNQQQGQDQQQGQQSGSGDKEGTRPKRTPQKPKADVLLQVTKDGGISGRIGKDVRFSVTKDGAKLKAGSNYTVVTKDSITHNATGNVYVNAGGTPFVNKQWVVGGGGSDPIADNDKVLDQDEG